MLQRIAPALGNCSNVKSQPERSVMKALLLLRGQATCPLLNGEVGSWSLDELCWNGAQGQLQPQLMNAEGKPQMFANITIGGKCRARPTPEF